LRAEEDEAACALGCSELGEVGAPAAEEEGPALGYLVFAEAEAEQGAIAVPR